MCLVQHVITYFVTNYTKTHMMDGAHPNKQIKICFASSLSSCIYKWIKSRYKFIININLHLANFYCLRRIKHFSRYLSIIKYRCVFHLVLVKYNTLLRHD